jgi:hypothetical protein
LPDPAEARMSRFFSKIFMLRAMLMPKPAGWETQTPSILRKFADSGCPGLKYAEKVR